MLSQVHVGTWAVEEKVEAFTRKVTSSLCFSASLQNSCENAFKLGLTNSSKGHRGDDLQGEVTQEEPHPLILRPSL